MIQISRSCIMLRRASELCYSERSLQTSVLRTSLPFLQCKGGDSKELSLGVTIKSGDNAVWHCFRGKCGWASSVKSRYPVRSTSQFGGSYSPSTKSRETALQKKRFPATKLPRPEDFLELDEEQLAFFKNRKISEGTFTRNGVKKQRSYCPQLQKEVDALAFPYMRRGELVNVKYRGPEKAFWQVRGGAPTFRCIRLL